MNHNALCLILKTKNPIYLCILPLKSPSIFFLTFSSQFVPTEGQFREGGGGRRRLDMCLKTDPHAY